MSAPSGAATRTAFRYLCDRVRACHDPSMLVSSSRALLAQASVDDAAIVELVDHVLLPAARGA